MYLLTQFLEWLGGFDVAGALASVVADAKCICGEDLQKQQVCYVGGCALAPPKPVPWVGFGFRLLRLASALQDIKKDSLQENHKM